MYYLPKGKPSKRMLSPRSRSVRIHQAQLKDLNRVELLHRHPHVRVPELLYHDEENSILIMSDLGCVPTLMEYLTDHPDPSSSHPAIVLGEFLADIHHLTSHISDEALRQFKNEDSSDVILDLVGSLPRRLLKSVGVPDADILGEMVEQEVGGKNQEPCFGMVDLWPGSILVADNFVGLVDWEYAGRSSAGRELGMLTAHLRIPLLSPTVPTNHSSVVTRFTTSFLTAYAACFLPRTQVFVRAALLAHGRELINAVEFQSANLDGRTLPPSCRL